MQGFKTVAGGNKWSISDSKGLVSHLTSEGFGERDIFRGEPELVSRNQAGKLYKGKGAGAKRAALDEYFEQRQGPPAVVPDSDKRPALVSADKEFEDYKRPKGKTDNE